MAPSQQKDLTMITGSHFIVFSTDAEADRAFFRDVLELPFVDVGGGWLVFRAPPAEVAFHPSDHGGGGEFFLLTDDLVADMSRLEARGVPLSKVEEQSWGTLTKITLPSGGELGLYQPKHESPPA
jgi:catechol 2,3-dioxygenase-like lactoylglutathione lyase family enzyme